MIRTTTLYARNGRLYISAYTDCGRVRVATGVNDTPKNRQEMLQKAENIVYKHLRGEDVVQNKSLKLMDLADELLNSLQQSLKNSTIYTYKSVVKNLLEFFGNKDIRVIGSSQKSFFENKHIRYTCFFNRLIDLANQKQDLNLKPIKVKKIKSKIVQDEIKPFSLDEIETILNHASGQLKTYLFIAFFTGARSNEILALRWEDLDFENNKIAIIKTRDIFGEITTPKTKSSMRYIDMLEPLKKYLLELKQTQDNDENLFSYHLATIRQKFKTLLASLNIQKRKIYHTRHTFASIMLQNGEEPLWVGCMLGHKDLNITFSCYTKFIPQKRDRASFLNDIF